MPPLDRSEKRGASVLRTLGVVALGALAAGVAAGVRRRSRPTPFSEDFLRAATERLPGPVRRAAEVVERHLHEGRFQRSLSLVTAVASVASGAEAAYEHYRGSYGQRVMYTPVVLSAALAGAGVAAAIRPRLARTVLRPISWATLIDGVAGTYYHVRGVARKPGGWRLPVANIIMGPPLFAPLLFGTAAYLGIIASYLRPERTGRAILAARDLQRGTMPFAIATGHYQKHLAAATFLSAAFSGAEALYSHYKNNFRYFLPQISPLVVAPVLMAAAAASVPSRRMARTVLPAASLVAIANGAVGTFYHARGILRRPGGRKNLVFNIIYGPPIFAPLLFASSGALGLTAALMRRER